MGNGNLAAATGAEGRMRLDIEGETFEIRRLSMKAGGRIEAWLKAQDPPGAVRRAKEVTEGLDPAVARQVIESALAEDRAWPPSVILNGPIAMLSMMQLDGGTEELLTIILRQARPDLSDDRCRELIDTLDVEMVDKILGAAFNLRPEVAVTRSKAEFVMLDPDGLERLTTGLVAALEVNVPAEQRKAAVDAATAMMAQFGTVIRLEVRGESPTLPKGEVGPAPKGRSRSSTPSTPSS
jgi:hypothetical protein